MTSLAAIIISKASGWQVMTQKLNSIALESKYDTMDACYVIVWKQNLPADDEDVQHQHAWPCILFLRKTKH